MIPVFAKLPFSFDSNRLKEDLKHLEQTNWIQHYKMSDYKGDWSVLPLRSICGHPSVVHASPSIEMYDNTPFLLESDYFKKVIACFKCPLASVRLMKLAVAANILEHTDDMGEDTIRLHIPIQTNDKVEFIIAGNHLNMKEGEVWMGNFNLPHSVANYGETDRIHLVLDAMLNDWLKKQINLA